jgi:hypothetical protein
MLNVTAKSLRAVQIWRVIPFLKGEGGAKHRVRGKELIFCTPHPPHFF